MIEVRKYSDLGHMQIDWLNAHYHFSFADYHDPKRMGLGPLRVINDDIVSAGGGFDFHPHRDMEIITYVREGAITHEDSLGNRGITKAGDVQVMAAGTGIVHAEWNEQQGPTRLYQIWIHPRTKGRAPGWAAREFPKDEGGLKLLASGLAGDEGKALAIDADAALWGGNVAKGRIIEQKLDGAGYLLVSKGAVKLGDTPLAAGDGAILANEKLIRIKAEENAELVLIDLPTVRI